MYIKNKNDNFHKNEVQKSIQTNIDKYRVAANFT